MEKHFRFFRYSLLPLLLFVFSIADGQTSFRTGGISYTVTSDSTVMVIRNENYKGKIVIPAEVTARDITYRVTALDNDVFSYTLVNHVEIPSSITEISNNAFNTCFDLTEVVLPESMKSIGTKSFYGCSSLRKLELPESVETIGASAFGNCTSLTQMTIPHNVAGIATSAFQGCQSLVEVTLPSDLQYIAGQAFLGCSALQEINWPESLKEIGQEAFKGCTSLEEVEFHTSLENLGKEAFSNSGLRNVTILEGQLTELPFYCFSECQNLETVVLSGNVTHILGSCFESCSSLTKATLLGHLQEVGSYSFRYCKSLQEVRLGDEVKIIGEAAFDGCSTLTTVEFGNSLEKISYMAFVDCYQLQSIELPASLSLISAGAFDSCSNLMKVTCHGEVPPKCSLDPFNKMTFWFATLVVPEACKNRYLHSEGWEHFECVEEASGNYKMVSIRCNGDGGSVAIDNLTASEYNPVWTSVPAESPLCLMVQTNSRHVYRILVNGADMTNQVVDNQLTIPSVTEDLDINVSFDYRKFALSLHQAEGGAFNLHERANYKLKVEPREGSRIAFAGFDGGEDVSSWAIDEQGRLDIDTQYVDRELKIVFEKDNQEE